MTDRFTAGRKIGRGGAYVPFPLPYVASFVLLAGFIAFSLHSARNSASRNHGDRDAVVAALAAQRPSQAARPSGALSARRSRAGGHPANLNQPQPLLAQVLQGLNQTSAVTGQLGEFLRTGRVSGLRELTSDQLEELAREVAANVSVGHLAELAEQHLKIPGRYILEKNDPVASVRGVLAAMTGTSDGKSLNRPNLIITDRCEQDGRVTGQRGVLPASTRQVYAVFENDGSLQGLEHVLAVWRKTDDDRITFTECEPIHAATQYNYVWVQTRSALPPGTYHLDLCDAKGDFQILAGRSFQIE